MHRTIPLILFLCSGNYYRSRFAEILFNHLAARRNLPWRAFSRGLAVDRPNNNVGPISPDTVKTLTRRQIPHPAESIERMPQQVSQVDLERAEQVIALKETEHRPMMRERYPDWEDRIVYWHIHDLDVEGPELALSELEEKVRDLIQNL